MSDLICKYCKHKIIKNRCEYCGVIYTAEKGKEKIKEEEINEEIQKEEKLLTQKQSAILFYLITAATLIMIIIWSYIFI
jgi:predicted nucleic acid-binding Zn ribbon protein